MLLQDLKRASQDLAEPSARPGHHRAARRAHQQQLDAQPAHPGQRPVQRCTALVHPHDAARLGLQDGGWHASATPAGRSVQAQVQISAEMMPGVVSLPHGWGHDLPGAQLRVAAERPGANLNALLDDQLRDPLSGNAVLGGLRGMLEKSCQQARAQALGAGVMNLRQLHNTTAQKIDAVDSSFWAACNATAPDSPTLGLMERQRLKQWIQYAYEGFANVGA
jgi:hypothetical protein